MLHFRLAPKAKPVNPIPSWLKSSFGKILSFDLMPLSLEEISQRVVVQPGTFLKLSVDATPPRMSAN